MATRQLEATPATRQSELGDASVAVVIVNANAGELLDRALASVERQTVAPHRVIVIDNASSDDSLAGIDERNPTVELIRLDENVGFATANNIGVAAAADCDWVALLNPDAFPEPRWLEELLAAAAASPQFTFFASRLVKADEPGELDGTGDSYHVSGWAWRRDHGRPIEGTTLGADEIFSPCAAAALYRREAFLSVGGFDESYFCYFEDSDLSFRLRLAGHRCLYVPCAVVHHVGSAIAGRESDFSVYHSQRNMVWTYVKDMPSPLVWIHLPHHLFVNVLCLAWYALRGQGRVVLKAKRDALRGLPGVLRKRRAIQEARAVRAGTLEAVLAAGVAPYAAALERARRSRR